MYFHKYNNGYTFIKINNLMISNNYATSIQSDFNLKTQNLASILLQSDVVNITNLNILRGYGLKNIIIQNPKVLRIESSIITQSDEHKFLVFINILITNYNKSKVSTIYNGSLQLL
ncbi:unnamed protein product [Paramecium pentaurelia]|uniref:Uncharacterized protein n=1 Tax=Paramecium pentaurelia TaxID=43138 RepID=A0A8S1UR49_9CILI|nr:unnamed protein product [Paramecium pentaurelia]